MEGMDSLIAQFVAEFGTKPRSFSAPGRINLIGEHTDYNKGFVLPAGIDLSCQLAIASSSDDRFTIIANDLNERINCDDLGSISDLPHWTKYIVGVIKAFETRGVKVRPFQAIVQSTIPIGAGLSSSAALESVFAYALNLIYGSSFSQMQLTEIAKEAENKYVGVQCGIMDMFASIHAQKDHAMFLDCRSLAFEQIPLNMRDHTILLFDTQIKHDLATSEYNDRRVSCEDAVAVLNELGLSCSSLRDISTLQLYRCQHQMHPQLYKRAKHVVEENQRVMDFVAAMAEKNWKRAGALMYASHNGLKDDYEVSCEELDFLVNETIDIKGVTGSRMMGGGFGGCTINMVKAHVVDEVIDQVTIAYQNKYGVTPKVYIANTSDGAREHSSSY
jgi:galactokinase